MLLCSFNLVSSFEMQFFHRDFTHFEFLDLSGYGDREIISEPDIPGDLIMGNFTLAEVLYLFFSEHLAG